MKPQRTSPKQIERCERLGNHLWACCHGRTDVVFKGAHNGVAEYHVFVDGEPHLILNVSIAEIDAYDAKDDLFALADLIKRRRKRGQ